MADAPPVDLEAIAAHRPLDIGDRGAMIAKALQRAVRLSLAVGALVASILLLARVTGVPRYADWLVVVTQILVLVPAAVIVAELGAFLRPLFIKRSSDLGQNPADVGPKPSELSRP